MLCPSCLSLMRCESAIHAVPNQPGKERMDLHCFNCNFRSHMGVITEDPKEWVCHSYNFIFETDNDIYCLSGYDYVVDPHRQHRDPTKRKTILSTTSNIVLETDFVSLSTGDNMHEEAWKLFERLRKLVVFS